MFSVNQVATTDEQGCTRYFRNTNNHNKETILYKVVMQNDGFVFVTEKPKTRIHDNIDELNWKDTDGSLAHDFIFMCEKLESAYTKIHE